MSGGDVVFGGGDGVGVVVVVLGTLTFLIAAFFLHLFFNHPSPPPSGNRYGEMAAFLRISVFLAPSERGSNRRWSIFS